MAEYDETTERKLILYAVRDALNRLKYSCSVTVHTECEYIASVLMQGWLDRWQRNGWKSSRGREVKDAVLWSMLLQDLEETGHVLTAVAEKHEYSEWMRWNMQIAQTYKETFCRMEKRK